MAIGSIPPWVRGPDTLGALSSGASAGSAAGHLEQSNRFESARLGMEAQRIQQNTALAQAQLQQSAEQHQMEFESRKKLAEQNQLREQQRLNIENAYKTAALGIAQGRLEETKQVAEDKAKTAAMQFQREQNFARDVASGVPVMEAYRRNPVSPSLLNSVERNQDTNKPLHVGDAIVRRQPDGTYKEEYRAPHSDKPIKVGKNLVRLKPDGTVETIYGPTNAPTDDIMGAANPAATSNTAPSGKMFGGAGMIRNTVIPQSLPPNPKVPKVGEVYSGHKYKGGDPSDENNWEEVGE